MRTGFLASAAVLASPVFAQGAPTVVTDVRTTMTLADGWKFKQDDTITGAQAPAYDDSGWANVAVPHSWNRVGYYLPPSADRVNTLATINKIMGIGWYRLSFTPEPGLRGKRAWLEFDAASRVATVWLNGTMIGEHKGGFSRFRIDATESLKPGVPNLLVVRVDNSKPAPGNATADALPLTGDFFVHGGLYRPVRLIATAPIHLDMRDAGGPGVYATTQAVEGGTARVAVALKLRNDGRAATGVRVVTRLIDAAGAVAAESTRTVSPRGETTTAIAETLSVPAAHLWHGVDDPYLYRLSIEVRARGGAVLDRLDQPFGIRTMQVDAQRGFLLNGKVYPLRGVGYHQDHEGKGWAVSSADVARDVDILRDMGANSIRLTHYQHGQPIHDEANRRGLILWDEIPLVTAWTLGEATEATPGLLATTRQQLVELIRQNQNHPSVASWGIANEVDFGNSLPGFLTNSTGIPPDPLPILREMNALAKATDPSRPTAIANCCDGQPFAPGVTVPIVAPEADLAGVNRYFGWYYGTPDMAGPALDALHAKRPNQPLAVTEYGGGGATSIHTDNPLGGVVDARGRAQPEEHESYIHERNWAAMAARPYLWATWLWVGFDFASTIRHEGDAEDLNTKGLVTFDRKIRKDAYYFYRANWSANPTVHITGRRYVDRAYPVTDVRVYSNAERTELLVGGVSLGVRTDCPQRICVWDGVRLTAGENRISARGTFAGTTVEDQIAWQVAPDVVRATRIDSGAMVAARSPSGRFGSDTYFTGGTAATLDTPGGFFKPPVAAVIAGTTDAPIATTYRKGDFGYRVPLRDGRYTVTLTFVEPALKPGERVFDVLVGGRAVLPALDVAAASGGALTALRRSFPVTVTGGALALQFHPVRGDAIVSAIEVVDMGADIRP